MSDLTDFDIDDAKRLKLYVTLDHDGVLNFPHVVAEAGSLGFMNGSGKV